MEYAIDYSALKTIEDAYRRMPAVVSEELHAAVTEADLLIHREATERMPVGAGGASGLKGSLFHEEQVNGPYATGLVATAISYAVPVELGTRPHFPPIEPLIDWVKAKLGVSGDVEARGVAFAIARKIAVRGTKAQRPFGLTFQALEGQVAEIFDRALGRIGRRISGAEAG